MDSAFAESKSRYRIKFMVFLLCCKCINIQTNFLKYRDLISTLKYMGPLPDNDISNATEYGIYEMNPQTNMGTSGITPNYGVIVCFSHPGQSGENVWLWQRAIYVDGFVGGTRTKTNTAPWTTWESNDLTNKISTTTNVATNTIMTIYYSPNYGLTFVTADNKVRYIDNAYIKNAN